MSRTPFFSVIIPAYNPDDHINDTLNSVESQTFRDFEVIIVDDGSAVDVRERIGAFLDLPNYTCCRQHNQGPSAARNTGAGRAKGRFLVFLDCDDVVRREWLQTFHDLIEGETGRVGLASVGLWENDTRKILPRETTCAETGEKHFASFLAGTFAIDREVFSAVGGYDAKLRQSENFDFITRTVRYCCRQRLALPARMKALLTYRKDITGQKFKIRALHCADAQIRLIEKHKLLGKKASHRYLISCVNYYRAGMRQEASTSLRKAFTVHPLNPKVYYFYFLMKFPYLADRRWNRNGR
jgi:glycosyltransferase involved in cell wall biosynthesis